MIGGGVAMMALNFHIAATVIGAVLVAIGLIMAILFTAPCICTANGIKNGFDPKEDWWPCV